MRPRSISDPAYSPGLSTPSSAGAAGACAMVVRGRIDIETVSAPGPRVELVVVTTTFADWLAGSAVSVFVIENVTMASAPGASGPYGFEVSAAVKFAGSVRLTVPLCASSDQLWTLTGNSIVSPTTTVPSPVERPIRRAAGAVFSSQLSYSSHLPKRWKRPSTGDTSRTASSV